VQGEAFGWGYTEELLAAMVDRLGEVSYLVRSAWFKGKHEVPKSVRRPGIQPDAEEADPPRMSTPAEIKAFFSGQGTKVVYSDS
jgi:hypothetical protein